MPVGREMPDLGGYFNRWVYNAIEGGVNKTNAKIRSAIKSGQHGDALDPLQSEDEIAHAVNREFPYAIMLIQDLDGRMTSSQMKQRYPGTLPGYKPLPSFQQVAAFPLNPFRAWGCASIKVYGVQLGTDKIGHFTDMGMHYYQTYRGFLAKGESEQQAIQRAIDVGTKDPLKSESALLGYWTAGAYSNGDLAVNYIGFVFYRNLTEPQALKGQVRPPMLVRDGPYWRIAPHVRPDSDFFALFISNHLDEALNPSHYVPQMRGTIRSHAIVNSEGTLEHRRDRWGNRRSPAWFSRESRELTTYWGADYGHAGKDEELLRIFELFFPAPPKDAGARNRVGFSALHHAVAVGDLKAVQDLVSRVVDVNDAVRSDESFNSNWGDTPLHMAAQDGREEIARFLISRGADVNRANDRGNTPLHRAVEYSNVVALLLDSAAKVDAADVQGRTPLHWAAMLPDKRSVVTLLDRGANPNARDHHGQTPLHYVSRGGSAEVASALLARGADAAARDKFGATPLHVAAAQREPAIVSALLRAAGAGSALANAKDDFGCTALHDAARCGSEPAVAALLGGGADPMTSDLAGYTPLHLACRHGYDAVAVQLVARGASPSARSSKLHRTPIEEATKAGYTELAGRLSTNHLAQTRH
jgi:cytohesin